jgi:hypothetical protein
VRSRRFRAAFGGTGIVKTLAMNLTRFRQPDKHRKIPVLEKIDSQYIVCLPVFQLLSVPARIIPAGK